MKTPFSSLFYGIISCWLCVGVFFSSHSVFGAEGDLVAAINCGGTSVASPDEPGLTYAADSLPPAVGGTATGTASSLTGSYRYAIPPATFGYKFTVPNGNYVVKLRFYETGTVGQRIFNYAIENLIPVTGFDIAAIARNTLVDRTYDVVVADGELNISFSGDSPTSHTPKINGIVIRQGPPAGYTSWAAAHNLTGNNALPTAVPLGDGVTNLEKYFFGLNPQVAGVSRPLTGSALLVGGQNYLGLTFQRHTQAADVAVSVQRSTNLVDWVRVGTVTGGVVSGVGFVGESGAGSIRTVQFRDTQTMDTGVKAFMRLKITQLSSQTAMVLPAMFSDGMILQRDGPAPIFGTAGPGDEIHVTFAGQEKIAYTDANGRWKVLLDPLSASAVGRDLIIQGEGSQYKIVHDVMVGEVWLCAGQSNMEAYANTLNAADLGTAVYPNVRFFNAARAYAAQPLSNVTATWKTAAPTAAGQVSAIGYLFARDLHERTGVPVGMMQAAWGDTLIKFWTPLAALQANPALASYVQEWETLSPQMGTLPEPQRVPAAIFNGMVAPQAPYGVRGVLWYQGESDGWTPDDYHSLFVALIQGWRAAWNREVPFLFVQLPNYTTVATEPPNVSLWSELREAQEQTLSLPETEMVVTIDIGGESIHPTNKPEVARRLMLAARAKVYGENIPYSGPRFQQAVVNGSQVSISFTHVEGGLAVRDGGAIKGFALAGSNHQWYWADAVISGNSVVVSSAQVPNPVAVRYAWAFNPENNLINSVGLPCAPFRTDNW